MKLEKAVKNLGVETVQEIESLSVDELKTRITQANQAMEQVDKELENNPAYQDVKENLKALTAGKKEVNKRQNSIITVCLASLESKGS